MTKTETESTFEFSATDWIERELTDKIENIQKIDGGANNKIYKIISKNSGNFIFKEYFKDDRNRLEREFKAFAFIHKIGIDKVPVGIASDYINNCAIYNEIGGKVKSPEQFTFANIDQIITFVTQLQSIQPISISENFQKAVLSTNSFQGFINNIYFRIDKFTTYMSSNTVLPIISESFKKFKLTSRLIEQINILKDQAKLNIQINKKLGFNDWRLSPVDFGPHNMVIDSSENVFFIDFEYFGWDDPVKLIPNLIYHEGSRNLSSNKIKYLLDKYISLSSSQPFIIDRIDIALQLVSMDWLSILLWGITPEKMGQRIFSNSNLNIGNHLEKQIAKINFRLEELENPIKLR